MPGRGEGGGIIQGFGKSRGSDWAFVFRRGASGFSSEDAASFSADTLNKDGVLHIYVQRSVVQNFQFDLKKAAALIIFTDACLALAVI